MILMSNDRDLSQFLYLLKEEKFSKFLKIYNIDTKKYYIFKEYEDKHNSHNLQSSR